MRLIFPAVLSLAVLAGCATPPPPCTNAYRDGLMSSRAYWDAQPEEFYGYRGAVENLNYKISHFNVTCARKVA